MEISEHHRRFHAPHAHLAAPFGTDNFGRVAERTARFFGTPVYLITQTSCVIAWIAVNAAVVALRWDPYPFILLNLAFSTQAAYAAPLILLAQTRQAERDKAWSEMVDAHHDAAVDFQDRLLAENTRLVREVERMAERIYASIGEGRPPQGPA